MLVDQGEGSRRTEVACTDCGRTRSRRGEGHQAEVRSGRRCLQDFSDDFLSDALTEPTSSDTELRSDPPVRRSYFFDERPECLTQIPQAPIRGRSAPFLRRRILVLHRL